MFTYLLLAELFSISIIIVLCLSGDLSKIIKNYHPKPRNYNDETSTEVSLIMISIFLGWFIFPYFVWLLMRQIKYSRGHKNE